IVMATGFRAQEYLTGLRIRGRDGRDLHEAWGGTPRALLGLTVPGFPNFFIQYGPNTNGGNAITFTLERQASVIVRMIKRIHRDSKVLDTRQWAFERFTRWI